MSSIRHATLIGAALAAMIGGSLYSSAAEAKTCHPFGRITATAGIAVKLSTAKTYARVNWRVKVRAGATLGTAYTNWDLAEERDYNCEKKLGTHRCSAIARPCRP